MKKVKYLFFIKIVKIIGLKILFQIKVYLKIQVEYNLTDLLVDELTYLTDLNGDGEIGDVIKSIHGTDGSSSLFKTMSNAYL